MTVSELIKELEKFDKDKIVIITEPDGEGWDNIGNVYQEGSCIKITMDDNNPFEN